MVVYLCLSISKPPLARVKTPSQQRVEAKDIGIIGLCPVFSIEEEARAFDPNCEIIKIEVEQDIDIRGMFTEQKWNN